MFMKTIFSLTRLRVTRLLLLLLLLLLLFVVVFLCVLYVGGRMESIIIEF